MLKTGGAKVSQIIMWLLYLCIKPETSEINVTKAFTCHCKSTNISRVSRVSHGNFGQPDQYWVVYILGWLMSAINNKLPMKYWRKSNSGLNM